MSNRESKLQKLSGRRLVVVSGHLVAVLDGVFKSPGNSAVNTVPPAASW